MNNIFRIKSSLICLIVTAIFTVFFLVPQRLSFAMTENPKSDFTDAELEKLVMPIALYPDLLLQQILAASTFPEQILDAALFHEQGKSPEKINSQPWDLSVKSIANYPSLVSKMAGEIDWTLALASAFVNQNVELRKVIQDLRARAKNAGNLRSSSQQKVIIDESPGGNTVIIIEQAQPDVVYVPSGSTTVYQQPVSDSSDVLVPLASFGIGMALGYAMGDDDDDDHYYYAGGYYGPGFWHNDDAVDDWVDYRRDRWDDAYDFANDRQEWRQDNQDDWREYRQDLGRKRQDYLKEKGKVPASMSPEQMAQAKSRVDSARSSWQSGNGNFSKVKSAGFSNQEASARIEQARNNTDLQKKAQSIKSNPNFQQRSSQYKKGQGSFSQADFQNKSRSYGSGGRSYTGIASGSRSVSTAQTRGALSRGSSGSFRGAGAARAGGRR